MSVCDLCGMELQPGFIHNSAAGCIRALKNLYESVTSANADYVSTLTRLEARLQDKEGQIKAFSQDNLSLNNCVKELRDRESKLELDVRMFKGLNKDQQQLIDRLNTLKDGLEREVEELESDIEHLKSEDIRTSLTNLEEGYKNLLIENERYEQENVHLVHQAKLSDAHHTKVIQMLRDEVSMLEAKLKGVSAERSVDNLVSAVNENLVKERDHLKQTLSDYRTAANRELETAKAAWEKAEDDGCKTILKHIDEIEGLKAEISKIAQANDLYAQANEACQETIDALKQELHGAALDVKAHQSVIAQAVRIMRGIPAPQPMPDVVGFIEAYGNIELNARTDRSTSDTPWTAKFMLALALFREIRALLKSEWGTTSVNSAIRQIEDFLKKYSEHPFEIPEQAPTLQEAVQPAAEALANKQLMDYKYGLAKGLIRASLKLLQDLGYQPGHEPRIKETKERLTEFLRKYDGPLDEPLAPNVEPMASADEEFVADIQQEIIQGLRESVALLEKDLHKTEEERDTWKTHMENYKHELELARDDLKRLNDELSCDTLLQNIALGFGASEVSHLQTSHSARFLGEKHQGPGLRAAFEFYQVIHVLGLKRSLHASEDGVYVHWVDAETE